MKKEKEITENCSMRSVKVPILIFWIALVCVNLFVACDNPFEPLIIQKPLENGYGRININVSGENTAHQDTAARTVFPSTIFDKYVYTFTQTGKESGEVKTPDHDGYFILEVGSYTVEVQAYTGTAEPYTLAASGVSAQFNVGPGDNDPVTVRLFGVTAGAEGEFSFTITYPAGAEDEITLHKLPEMAVIPLTPDDLFEENGKTQTLQLETGTYLFTIIIHKDELYAGLVETVHIYPGMPTAYTKSFVNADLVPTKPPSVNDYTIEGTGKFSFDNSAKIATITRKENASLGEVTVFYNGTETPPVNTGTYTVTFNVAAAKNFSEASGLPAGTITIITPLTVDTWVDSGITSNGEERYKFTATAGTQYLHISFGTLDSSYGLNIQMYTLDDNPVGDSTRLYSSAMSISLTVTEGQEYYIKATPYNSSHTGTYKIGFNSTFYPPGITPLTAGEWADGDLTSNTYRVEWYKFTATAAMQYIHASFGTLNDLYVQVYNSSGATVGNGTRLTGSTTYISRTLTEGQEYYVRVNPTTSSSNRGTYQITFNTSASAPSILLPFDVTMLTAGEWANGNITSNGEQWYKFTATTDRQYLHVSFGMLDISYGIYVQVYNSSGATVGDRTRLYRDALSISRTLTEGQEYYVRITPYSSSYSGTYQITFNTSASAPPILLPSDVTMLTVNTWANGDIALNGEQWFKFTATASAQHIHVSFGTLTALNVQMYDSSGTTVGSTTELFSHKKFISLTLTIGQEYYVRVTPYSSSYSGTYQIMFSTTIIPPDTTVTALTANTWTNGNIPSSDGEQWFSFTATAATQYIHINFGTLSDLYVQVYRLNGSTIGDETSIRSSSSTRYISRPVTVGQEYYVRITNYYSDSGTYQIGFNAAFYTPGATVTTLTANTWTDENIFTSDGEWFRFTATSSSQYIHVNDSMVVYMYDSSGARVGDMHSLYGSTKYFSQTLTVGQVYYIWVRAWGNSTGGTYQIGFTASFIPPGITVTTLTAGEWANGDIALNSERWFKFTATADTQYIHINFGTLKYLNVQVYNSSGTTVGSNTLIFDSSYSKYISRTVTEGQEYYVKVTPYSSFTGTYQIAFNTSDTSPP
jgi:predicted RNA-binding protein with TRAM domain